MQQLCAPYPALRLLLFVVAGIVCGTEDILSLTSWLIVSLLSLALLFVSLVVEYIRSRKNPFPHAVTVFAYLLFVFSAFAAGCHYRFNTISESSLLNYTGREVLLYGKVAGRPSRYEKGAGWILDVREVFHRGRTETINDRAKIFLRTVSADASVPQNGDMVRVKGKLQLIPEAANRGEFDPRRYARMQQTWVQLYCAGPWHLLHTGETALNAFERLVVLPVYDYIVAAIDRLIPEGGERKLIRGVLLGEREVLDREVFEAFKTTGTAHVLAVSGLNVGLLALGIHVLLQRFKISVAGRWFSFALLAFILLVFSYVTGNSPSVKRAAIMSIVLFGGETLGRRSYGVNSLAVSDILILLFDPYDLFNPGFLMTNGAVLAILLVYPMLYPPCYKEDGILPAVIRFFLGSFFVSLAAIIGVSPIIAYYFGTFSVVSLAANLPVVLFSTVMMYALVPMLFFNLFSGYLASLFGLSGWLMAHFTLDSALFFSKVPFASISVKPDLFEVALYYVIIAVAVWYFSRNSWSRFCITLLFGLNAFLWYGILKPEEKGSGLVTVNLGRNLSLLYAAGGETLIVDGGRDARDAARIMRQIDEYHLPPPKAAVQFFSKDSLIVQLPVEKRMMCKDAHVILSSMEVTRPMEKVLSIRTRKRSLLYVSGISRLREAPAWKADVVILAVYRFREKQRHQLESWLDYVQPQRCIFLEGSFLTEQDNVALYRFVKHRPNTEIRKTDRQIVIQ
ncbi:MAG: ComEC family competence protein [Chlorobium sp.]|uniref:ComEC/Rec2 family competence protein n=1 Tax=Chlorobium sp. TaxID=1095 RepID=UPI0025C71DFA|nr:ComEC/Rec2 family competence protein [Chlorobium sp.]MCF8215691.1 ComEC family competence protein [Chlorobium sp.]MCF8270575.1 ComEC family competence protein [Chlorobium sp.]MCF8286900.1 ComEC family competence protein [Chlorobium sp.]MCF8290496.1 ComEC family competence protein [Chlorobium sp.]MCF8384582.1 ComEC family competence protein [Chlorobium sp.]